MSNEDTLRSLGKLLGDGEGERDAVHIAVVPAVAHRPLKPGTRVGLSDNGEADALEAERAVGVVDPYLTADVQKGQRFWLFLFPGSITSLRHLWTHPAFPAGPTQTAAMSAAERRLRQICDDGGFAYQAVLDAARYGDSLTNGYDSGISTDDEFWSLVETITGQTFDQNHRADVYFGCAC
jgi:hypothetical protein